MTDAPNSEGLILFRVDGISEPRGEKLVGEVRRPISRGQKAEGVIWATLWIPRPLDYTGRAA